ncbi:MAG: hypothetical protein ABS935_03170 [Solibacillus sp.]|uniref:hypothetical protein n=1 Tax=Solibacillus sp. TaxID=1909654 RepID=UPI00331618CF
MNIHTAYTIYNNGIQTVEPQLAEAIDRIIDVKSKAVDRYKESYEICERGMFKAHDLFKATQEKLDQVELAEVKARIEMEAIDGYYSALLKKRVQQVEVLQSVNHQLRTGIVDLREYIGYQPHSDLAENVVDILYKILNGENEDGEPNE